MNTLKSLIIFQNVVSFIFHAFFHYLVITYDSFLYGGIVTVIYIIFLWLFYIKTGDQGFKKSIIKRGWVDIWVAWSLTYFRLRF